MGTGDDGIACETDHLMCMVCGPLPGITRLDEDLRELLEMHPSRRLTIAERNWRTRNGWEPPELAGRSERRVSRSRPRTSMAGSAYPPRVRRSPG